MNASCYKIVFSKRLGALVAVGEHTLGQGKAAGTGIRTGLAANKGLGFAGLGFVGLLKAGVAATALALLSSGAATAAGLAPNALPTTALPTGALVNTGKVAISTQAAAMTIQQTTDKASVNWNAFNIGSGASVNVQQNSANSVLLNRVVGNDPSQILGKLTANGQVVLINPNGIVFGKDGSVAATAFTASTFGISEQDFANGKYNYTRNGSTAGVTVQTGATLSTTAPGGYVALIGASVDNQGTISTQGGTVVMAAGKDMALPTALTNNVSVPLSGKVRLELLPSTINSMVANSGTITTEGGQVLMQAAALSDAVASITHTGVIDTTGVQGGAVALQADQGVIRVSGSIKANSTNTNNKGADIVIGRDADTGVLAKTTDVSGAVLESKGGFVETSGHDLKIDGAQVKAANWLLDPDNIDITNGAATGSYSAISATALSGALTNGTNITVNTTGGVLGTSAVPITGSSLAPTGNIKVSSAISKTSTGNATLNLIADDSIALDNNIISSVAGAQLNINLTAKTGNISGAGNLNSNGGMLTVDSAIAGTLSGSISGTGGLTKAGTGTTSLSGATTYSGASTVLAGVLQFTNVSNSSAYAISSGAIAELNVATGVTLDLPTSSISGAGTLKKTGLGTVQWGGSAGTFKMSAGGLIDVQAGTFVGGSNNNETWRDNQSSLNVNSNATFNVVEASVKVDALTGAGSIQVGWNGIGGSITTGINGTAAGLYNTAGTALFSGVISNYPSKDVGGFVKEGAGTQILSGNNSYSGTTVINGGTLQIGNTGTTGTLGKGDVTLSNYANLNYLRSATTSIANKISGTGNVNAVITGNGNALTVDNTISLTNGKINLLTDGNLTVNKAISTTDNTISAIFLEAGKAIAAGISTKGVGDVTITSTGSVTAASGLITFMTGSIVGSTGLGVSAGNNRYNSDETTTSYTSALGSTGRYAIYREAPTLTATFNDASKTYDGLAYAGNNGVSAYTGFVNGDTNGLVGSTTHTGTAQGAKNAGTYTINGNALSGLGYKVVYTAGTLTVNKANLVLSGSRVYDASQTFAGQYLTAIGVAGETFTVTGSGDANNLISKNVQTAQKLNSITGLSLGTSANGGLSNNYNALSTTASSVNIAKAALVATGNTSSVTYNGADQSVSGFTVSGLQGSDKVSDLTHVTASGATAKNAGTYTNTVTAGTETNYTVTTANGSLDIAKANLVLSGTRVYDASQTFAGQYLTATGVNGETFTVTGSGNATNLSTKNVQTNQTLSSVKGLSLSDSSNGALSSNYNDISAAGSSVSVTAKNATITGTTTNLTYNGTSQSQNAAVLAGFVDADVSSGTVGATGVATGRNAGTYASNLSATGTDKDNYNITVTNANLVVGKKDASITGTTTNVTYNGASQTQSAAVLAGFVDVDLSSGTVSATGLATGRNVGSYTSNLSATGTDASNYNVTVTNKDLVIDKKSISLSGITAANKTYDGSNAATVSTSAAVFNDQISGDKLTVSSTGTFSDKNAATGKTVSLTNTLGGADLANYNVTTQASTTADISKKSITLDGITAANKTYDGNTTATVTAGAIATGVANETLAVSGTGTFSDKNAANGKTVTVANIKTLVKANGTGDWDNYNLTSTGSITTTANIDKKSVTLDSITAANKVYDGTDTAVIISGSISTGVSNETLAISGKGKFADSAPGTNKVVTVADVTTLTKTNGTGDWNNYKLNSTGSKTTKATITAVPPSPPAPTPSPASTSSGSAAPRVKIPLGSGNQFQLASVEMLVDEVCSASNLESCFCESSTVNQEVSICYEKKER